jgi:hypothetical protein
VNSFIHKKIKAGALQYTMFISVVIVILISTFLLLTFLQNHFKTVSNFHIQSIQNTDLGFQYVSEREIPYDLQQDIKLPSAIESELILTKKHWGLFNLLKVQSKVKNNVFEKIGLLGGFQVKKTALYLKDNNNALVLVGNTKIQGKVFLPKNGVKGGYISGHSYYGNQLIYGPIMQSNSELPIIKNRGYLEELSKGIVDNENLIFINLIEGRKILNSFSKPTQIYKQSGVLTLRNLKLGGNIIIQSDTLIRVDNTAKLSDVLLIAPAIEIMNNVTGNFQVIARNSIVVGENCSLSYPSVLLINEKKVYSSEKSGSIESAKIQISSNSIVKGIVAFLSNNVMSNYKPQIILEENSKVVGEVYCDKNFELKGDVYGSVYTNNFIAAQFGSVYQNHIYNGNIIEANLPTQYVGLPLENSIPKTSEWLY